MASDSNRNTVSSRLQEGDEAELDDDLQGQHIRQLDTDNKHMTGTRFAWDFLDFCYLAT
jgi:hypothetical protein